MIVYTDPQGSDAWLSARRGVITASRFRDCRDKLAKGSPSKTCIAYAMDVARERVGGMAPAKFQSAPMRFGLQEEPQARIALEIERGYVVEEAGFITDDDGRFGVSVDGLIGADGVVEIKTMVASETLFRAVVGGDASEYLDQCNGALWLLGRKWVDLALWAPDLPAGQLTVVRIGRDDDLIEAMEADLIAFDRLVTEYESALRAKVAAA